MPQTVFWELKSTLRCSIGKYTLVAIIRSITLFRDRKISYLEWLGMMSGNVWLNIIVFTTVQWHATPPALEECVSPQVIRHPLTTHHCNSTLFCGSWCLFLARKLSCSLIGPFCTTWAKCCSLIGYRTIFTSYTTSLLVLNMFLCFADITDLLRLNCIFFFFQEVKYWTDLDGWHTTGKNENHLRAQCATFFLGGDYWLLGGRTWWLYQPVYRPMGKHIHFILQQARYVLHLCKHLFI